MKLFILLACLSGALAFSVRDVDFDNLVPIYETPEWKAAHPESDLTDRRGRVWGGRLANPGELPYQVGILILLTRQSFCGGSIVSSNFVLSAAQCYESNPNAVVEIGNVDRNLVQQFINVDEFILHPAYDGNDNDIALLRLVRSITFTAGVGIIRLPNRRQVDLTFENQQARVSGWGTTGDGDAAPVQLLRIGFGQVISQAACRVRFPNSASGSTLCIDGDTVNFCSGDFGGPVTVQASDGLTTQIGVASFVNVLGCTRGFPAGFQRVSSYIEWIGQNSDVVIRDDF